MCVHPARYVESLCAAGGDGGPLSAKFGSAVPSDTRTTRLVIVESPSKAKTIAGYLGPDYFVEASFGHVRDLPRNAADVPAKYKGEAWARLGVDVDNGFHALYVVSQDRKAQIAGDRLGLRRGLDDDQTGRPGFLRHGTPTLLAHSAARRGRRTRGRST